LGRLGCDRLSERRIAPAYEGPLGEPCAHQLSSFVLLALLVPWAIGTERRHLLPSRSAAQQVGLMWSSASVAFEFLFGQYVIKDSWSKLLHAYNLLGWPALAR
jgi:hypothetical protein